MSARRPPVWPVVALVALVIATLALATYVVVPRGSTFERAVALLPDDTARVTFTDWAGVRRELGCREVSACEPELEDSDLGTASALIGSDDILARDLGWGPQSLDWELLGQGPEGQILIVRLDDEVDLSAITDAYADSGYRAPKEDRLAGGVWRGGGEVLSRLGLTDTILGNVAFVESRHLLLSSDDPRWLAAAVEGMGDGLDFPLAGAVDEPLAAVGFVGDRACSELSFATADQGASATAERLVEEAGGVSPLDGYLVALGADRAWTAAFRFEEDRQARHDARSRQALAGAEDPGQMESYPDLFRVDRAKVDGRNLVLRGRAAESAYALSETTQGPVLFASC